MHLCSGGSSISILHLPLPLDMMLTFCKLDIICSISSFIDTPNKLLADLTSSITSMPCFKRRNLRCTVKQIFTSMSGNQLNRKQLCCTDVARGDFVIFHARSCSLRKSSTNFSSCIPISLSVPLCSHWQRGISRPPRPVSQHPSG